jgi:hypothetical protein
VRAKSRRGRTDRGSAFCREEFPVKNRTALLSLLLAALGPSACIHGSHPHTRPSPGHDAREARRGPPPHAPAHGYRHKHDVAHGGVDLIFDSGLGVYVVVGWPDHYWHLDRYYRFANGLWMVSARIDGGWADCEPGRIPDGLREKHARAKGHWKHPAKHAR